VRDPLKDWSRKDAALAGTFSVQQALIDRTRPGLKIVQVVQAALAAQVAWRIDDRFDPQRPSIFVVIFSGRVSRGRDLRRPVVDSVADETLAARSRLFHPLWIVT